MTILNGLTKRAAIFMAALMLSAGASAQVTFSVADGKVTGAQNVNVGGSFYDVVFGDTYIPTAGFVDRIFNRYASEALVEQVFVAGAPLNLDQSPAAMRGCTSSQLCWVISIDGDRDFAQPDSANVLARGYASTINYEVSAGDEWFEEYFGGFVYLDHDLTPRDRQTYAHWRVSQVSAVPEPETYAMMLAGLGLIGAAARRRKAKQA